MPVASLLILQLPQSCHLAQNLKHTLRQEPASANPWHLLSSLFTDSEVCACFLKTPGNQGKEKGRLK